MLKPIKTPVFHPQARYTITFILIGSCDYLIFGSYDNQKWNLLFFAPYVPCNTEMISLQ